MPLNVWTPPKPKRSYLSLPDGWDDTWNAAKAASATTPAWMLAYGDSITQGLVATDPYTLGWFALVRTYLTGIYPINGDFWSCAQTLDVSSSLVGAPWVVNSTVGRVYQRYACGTVPTWTGTPTNVITFTTPYACTDMDIIYYDFATVTGGWTYQVDGGAAVPVTPAGVGYLKRIQLTGLGNTAHTINFSQTTASLNLMPYGVATYHSRTAGIGYANMGASSRALGDNFRQLSGGPLPDNFGAFAGQAATATGFGFPMQPSLCIIAMGINDLGQGSGGGLAQFEICLVRMCRALRRGTPNCSLLFLINSNPDPTFSDVTSGWFGNSYDWGSYIAIYQRVAHMFNAAIFNVSAKWGSTPVAQGFMPTNQCHPTNAGHADIANVLTNIL